MRLLMLARFIAPSGGIETSLVDLATSFVRAGHQVQVYACQPFEEPNQNVERLGAGGVEVSACPRWLAAIAGMTESKRLDLFERCAAVAAPLLVLPAAVDALVRRRSIRRSLQGIQGKLRGWIVPRLRVERLSYLPLDIRIPWHRPDTVHVHGWGYGIDPPGALAWSRSRGLPTVYTEHNSPQAWKEGDAPPPIDLASAVIACSEAGARTLRAALRNGTPVSVIPYSVADPTNGAAPPEPRADSRVTLTCLARLSLEHKGQDVLLHAMRRLVDRHPNTRLLLAGDGASRGRLERMTAELGLSGDVEFLGHVPRTRLPWLMEQTDIVVLASRWEGLPVSIIESMAFGKPVVATDAGGNSELVEDGVTGRIVPVGDEEALAEALCQLIEAPETRRRMGAEARKRFVAGRFGPGEVAQATLTVYEGAMASRRAATSRVR